MSVQQRTLSFADEPQFLVPIAVKRRVVLRFVALGVIAGILGAAAALGAQLAARPAPRSSVTLAPQAGTDGNGMSMSLSLNADASQRWVLQQEAVLTSLPVLTAAARAVGVPVDELAQAVTVSKTGANDASLILTVREVAGSTAQRQADAVVQAYADQRLADVQRAQQARYRSLTALAAKVRARGTPGDVAAANELVREAAVTLAGLPTSSGDVVSVLSPAAPAVTPGVDLRWVVLTGLAGSTLAMLLAFTIWRHGDRAQDTWKTSMLARIPVVDLPLGRGRYSRAAIDLACQSLRDLLIPSELNGSATQWLVSDQRALRVAERVARGEPITVEPAVTALWDEGGQAVLIARTPGRDGQPVERTALLLTNRSSLVHVSHQLEAHLTHALVVAGRRWFR